MEDPRLCRKTILKWSLFYCYVSLPESNPKNKPFLWTTSFKICHSVLVDSLKKRTWQFYQPLPVLKSSKKCFLPTFHGWHSLKLTACPWKRVRKGRRSGFKNEAPPIKRDLLGVILNHVSARPGMILQRCLFWGGWKSRFYGFNGFGALIMVKPCGLCASSKRSRTSLGASGRRELEMISGIAQALRHVVVVQSVWMYGKHLGCQSPLDGLFLFCWIYILPNHQDAKILLTTGKTFYIYHKLVSTRLKNMIMKNGSFPIISPNRDKNNKSLKPASLGSRQKGPRSLYTPEV